MNQKILSIAILIVIVVGFGGYFVVRQHNTQAIRFEVSSTIGAPPLSVSFGAFSSYPLQFDEFSIEYGDGSHDSLQQRCSKQSGTRICQVEADHKYISSGTFTATLRGIRKGNSKILGTLTIVVGNPLNVTKTVGEKERSFLIQKINRDSVEGLLHQTSGVKEAYPLPVEPAKIIHIGDDIGYWCEGISDKLTSIDFSGQRITFTISWSKPPGKCPE